MFGGGQTSEHRMHPWQLWDKLRKDRVIESLTGQFQAWRKPYTEEQLMAKVATLFEEVEDVSSAENILNMAGAESTGMWSGQIPL